MGMIFANRHHARTLAWVTSSRKILFSESRATPDMGVDPCKGRPCLISIFELSGHPFGTMLKSFALTFQFASSLLRLNIVLVECKEHCFRLQNSRNPFFPEKNKTAGLHYTESGVGMLKLISNIFQLHFKVTLPLHGPIFRKSSENLDDMTQGPARVPKIIPMQG